MSKSHNFKLMYAISLGVQLGFLVVASFVGFILLGLFLDRHFATSPLFLALGILVSFLVTLYETYDMLVPLIKEIEDDKH